MKRGVVRIIETDGAVRWRTFQTDQQKEVEEWSQQEIKKETVAKIEVYLLTSTFVKEFS